MTTFPEVFTLPSSLPSILKSASETISPLIFVFFSILLGCPPTSVITLGFLLLSENICSVILGLYNNCAQCIRVIDFQVALCSPLGSYVSELSDSCPIKLQNSRRGLYNLYCFSAVPHIRVQNPWI